MSKLVGNPKDRFSCVEAHIIYQRYYCLGLNEPFPGKVCFKPIVTGTWVGLSLPSLL